MIGLRLDSEPLIRVTSSVAARDRKKTEEGIRILPPRRESESKSNPASAADPPAAQILMRATTEQNSDTVRNTGIWH
jgi:hypothetical protein